MPGTITRPGSRRRLERGGYRLFGLDATVAGTVPLGGGLSSSAALEVATAFALALASDLSITERELALLCQKAENDFVGAKVGVMDQFISVFGQYDHAIFLDCRILETQPDPAPIAARMIWRWSSATAA